ncbi:MAG: cyclopropane-fatty-acyl-phospholipid synthase family protein [Verrucomicrobiota bacterium]|nr:cyclopropane-fatty-acyl-phospholipid synthase family protein [Verrucomicrobiota bacterium]MED5282091.1 cyclopropane-fatty-acyl-phospholipid synthase family protein [Verrucomicrobiota bacterium]|tara:strand:+ start:1912 stop:2952 length:1041 start_codon:yes stop_codon:yes gene_type:complete
MSLTDLFIDLAERGFVPDFLIRAGIRKLCRKRLLQCRVDDCEANAELAEQYLQSVDQSPLAVLTEKANEQHYEVPSDFYQMVLGKNLKYSCCHFDDSVSDLSMAEDRSLALTCEHADLHDGQRILELGCGWGSLSLWMAANFPGARITSVSNSHSQREYIISEAKSRNLPNLEVVTADVNVFSTKENFERVVSVEMFEHVRNHRGLFRSIHDWLEPGGKLFTHVFCHRSTSYPFVVEGEDDWMSRHFFSGGTMPADELFLRICGKLELERRWRWSGEHYAKTAEAWLRNTDRNQTDILDLFARDLSAKEALRAFHRWRIFFLACSETFGLHKGQEWWVSHYLFKKP